MTICLVDLARKVKSQKTHRAAPTLAKRRKSRPARLGRGDTTIKRIRHTPVGV